jgi:murein tripeptide amidase MpaA
MNIKYFLITVVALLIIGGGVYYFYNQNEPTYTKEDTVMDQTATTTEMTTEKKETATTTENISVTKTEDGVVIGKSVAGNDIKAYHFGNGKTELLFIGGIHGGYEWNTSLLAFEMIDWLKKNPKAIPDNITVTVIPVLNPDGLKKVTGTTDRFSASQVSQLADKQISGRYNGNNVDLNRNFDCKWQAVGTWQDKEVSGGKSAFSEPEAQTIRSYVTTNKPKAIITWFSAAGGVYASECDKGILPETQTLTDLFAQASNYPAHKAFTDYKITGDMVNWFASQNIPAISVLLTTHDQTEWSKNQAGVEAILKHYAK